MNTHTSVGTRILSFSFPLLPPRLAKSPAFLLPPPLDRQRGARSLAGSGEGGHGDGAGAKGLPWHGGGRGERRHKGEGSGERRLGGGRGARVCAAPPSWALVGPLVDLPAVARGPGCLKIAKFPLVGCLINYFLFSPSSNLIILSRYSFEYFWGITF